LKAPVRAAVKECKRARQRVLAWGQKRALAWDAAMVSEKNSHDKQSELKEKPIEKVGCDPSNRAKGRGRGGGGGLKGYIKREQ
jgi:hypothetical protein